MSMRELRKKCGFCGEAIELDSRRHSPTGCRAVVFRRLERTIEVLKTIAAYVPEEDPGYPETSRVAVARRALDDLGVGWDEANQPKKRRLRVCVESWPECATGLYDPRCCRFPKSCSCTVYDLKQVKDSDLEPAREANMLTCEMVKVESDDDGMAVEGPECGKPRRREVVCDECFEALISAGDFTRAEAEKDYPLVLPICPRCRNSRHVCSECGRPWVDCSHNSMHREPCPERSPICTDLVGADE